MNTCLFFKRVSFNLEYPRFNLQKYLNDNAGCINALYIGSLNFFEDEQFNVPNDISKILFDISKCNTKWIELKY